MLDALKQRGNLLFQFGNRLIFFIHALGCTKMQWVAQIAHFDILDFQKISLNGYTDSLDVHILRSHNDIDSILTTLEFSCCYQGIEWSVLTGELMPIETDALANYLGATLIGSGSVQIIGVSGVEFATPDKITFLSEDKYHGMLKDCRAGAIIVLHPVDNLLIPQLVVKDINRALISSLEYFTPRYSLPGAGIDPSAKVHPSVQLGKGVSLGAFTSIEEGVTIDDDSFIGEGCKIGRNSKIGRNTRLDSRVVVYHDCIIGSHVILQANTVIGSTGFGYVYLDGRHQLVPHIGNVILEDFVEIGANCCVDRAKFDSTRIGAGTKIDNLVQIGHNTTIGRCCLIAGMTGISGSCRIGDGVIMGGQVGISDHVTVGDGSMIGGKSMVIRDVGSGVKVLGIPAIEKIESLRIIGLTRRLPELFSKMREIEHALKERLLNPDVRSRNHE